MLLTDFIARHQLPIAVATLDTGLLPSETLALIPRIEQRYGLPVERHAPRHEATIAFARRHGEQAMHHSIELRKSCFELRKLQPLARMLNERNAWVTGLRREQSAHRGTVTLQRTRREGQGMRLARQGAGGCSVNHASAVERR
jgi:phosphoadenosine phosphosulfate reductase